MEPMPSSLSEFEQTPSLTPTASNHWSQRQLPSPAPPVDPSNVESSAQDDSYFSVVNGEYIEPDPYQKMQPYIVYGNVPPYLVWREAQGNIERYILQFERKCGNFARCTPEEIQDTIALCPDLYISVEAAEEWILEQKNQMIFKEAIGRHSADPKAKAWNKHYIEWECFKAIRKQKLRSYPDGPDHKIPDLLLSEDGKRNLSIYGHQLPIHTIYLCMQDRFRSEATIMQPNWPFSQYEREAAETGKDIGLMLYDHAEAIRERTEEIRKAEINLIETWKDLKVDMKKQGVGETFFATLCKTLEIEPNNPFEQPDMLEWFYGKPTPERISWSGFTVTLHQRRYTRGDTPEEIAERERTARIQRLKDSLANPILPKA